MECAPSKEQNPKGKVVLVVKKENTRIEYKDGVRANEETNVDTVELASDDSSDFTELSSKLIMNQKALGYK